MALLEIPGIIVALMLARTGKGGGWKLALHEVLTGKGIFLLIGGLVIGMVSGPARLAEVQPFFTTAFKGVPCLFMIELGLVTGYRLEDVKTAGFRLMVLGVAIPILHGALGVGAGVLAGLSPGGCAVMGAMAGRASCIAAPSAVRVALPQANHAYTACPCPSPSAFRSSFILKTAMSLNRSAQRTQREPFVTQSRFTCGVRRPIDIKH